MKSFNKSSTQDDKVKTEEIIDYIKYAENACKEAIAKTNDIDPLFYNSGITSLTVIRGVETRAQVTCYYTAKTSPSKSDYHATRQEYLRGMARENKQLTVELKANKLESSRLSHRD